jgi:hypothetical protein
MRKLYGNLALALLLLAMQRAPISAAEDQARDAVRIFGQALKSDQASGLRPVLPERGRVHLSLVKLGPEEGSFGAQQVEALFRDFLAEGAVRSFEVIRFESDGQTQALVHGHALLTDRQGRPARIGLRLSLHPEGSRWVLRELKETPE